MVRAVGPPLAGVQSALQVVRRALDAAPARAVGGAVAAGFPAGVRVLADGVACMARRLNLSGDWCWLDDLLNVLVPSAWRLGHASCSEHV